MKRIVVNMLTAVIMAAILCACGGCKSKSGGIPQITMTVMPNVYGNVFSASIGLAGSGTASINWGDGSKSQTVTLLDDALAYTHDYSADKASDIVITGENITGFFCGDIYEYYLETLDVSKNPALEELSCSNSPLNVLDVSKNTALKKLVCYNNGLETLDLSRNIALEYLDCSYNNLTALDVSRNTALTELDCSYNNLTRLDLSANPNLIELISMENPFEQSDDSLTWQCGENLIYTLSGGVLTISGTGAMYDYMPAGGPDQEFEGFRYYPIQTVVLPDGITTIGDYAFGGCEGLTTVVIPSSVTSIGNWAFTGCESLTSVAIPNSVTLIGSEAFAGCSSLKNIAIPNSVTDISMFAFYNSGLTSVVIPNSVTSIGAAAFAYCGDLTTVTIPGSVTDIRETAFSHSNLTVIYNLAVTPQTINDNVFNDVDKSECTLYVPSAAVAAYKAAGVWQEFNVEAMKIESGRCGDNLTWTLSGGALTVSGTGAMYDYGPAGGSPWYYYEGLAKAAVLPDGLTHIGEYAFNQSELISVNIPSSVTSIGKEAFAGNKLTSVTIPAAATSVGYAAFSGCRALIYIAVEDGNPAYISEDGILFNMDKTELIQYPAGKKGAYAIPSSVTSVAQYSFFECIGLTSVDIPSSVTSVGELAFAYCESLTDVTIPNSVTFAGEGAFAQCYGLTAVTIPASVTELADYSFIQCRALTAIYNQAVTPQTVSDNSFSAVNKSKCTLYVPATAVNAYKKAEGWKDFQLIMSYD